jgi:ATP-dependent RNA helicase DeaD
VSSAPAFSDLGLRAELQRALETLGYEEPTPIQHEAIPLLLDGRDLVGQAATGTGKTAAFALPLLQRVERGRRTPQALVLVPTRELAIQVAEAIHRYGRDLSVRVLAIYGGQPIGRQLRAFESGVDVVVATPGRALDHLARGSFVVGDVSTVVLDEADEMLDMGFAEDIEAILQQLPPTRQTVLFSATVPARINGLVKRYLSDPVRVKVHRDGPARQAKRVRQVAYIVARPQKVSALGRVLDIESPAAALVFCGTRDQVDSLAESLIARGHRAESLHGGMTQDQRERVMQRLRSGATELLVATDVAARGLDIEHLTHVVNFDLPSAPDSYVHRIGRVGRAGRDGVAITLVEPRQHRLLKTIEKQTKQSITVETLPTVADLRARRLELTRAALAQALVEDDYEQYRVVVDTLDDEHDLMQITLAAVKLAHETRTVEADLEEIPEARTGGSERKESKRAPHDGQRRREVSDTARVFIGLGYTAKIRPQDLVGAIANETSLSGRQIGAIEITDRFSTVEVPAAAMTEVIDALKATAIKGRKARVEPYRPGA